ncbi:MAG TPA: CPBP family glutamic-type intramembrane protease [Desertimonas sp.]|nr:CPBP family glutamic-type intramembrane protease [Desertimonas sp.]
MISQPVGTFGPPSSAPAGWYPDPHGSAYARYYDGYRWTPYVAFPDQVGAEPQPAEQPHPELPIPIAIGAIVILAASLIASREVLDALIDRDWNIVVYMAIAVAVGYGPSIAWMWYASRQWGTGRVFSDLGVRFRWVDLGWGPLIWVSTVAAMGIAVGLMRFLDVPYRGNLDVDNGSPFERDNTSIAALLVSAVIFAPIVEEALFRGAMLRGLLSKMAAVWAIVLQAVLFGAAHFDPDFGRESIGLIIALSVAGAGFGLASYLLRRLGPVIIAHAVMNAVAITVVLNS